MSYFDHSRILPSCQKGIGLILISKMYGPIDGIGTPKIRLYMEDNGELRQARGCESIGLDAIDVKIVISRAWQPRSFSSVMSFDSEA